MQYLLTEDEMEEIRQARRSAERMPKLEALTNVCKHLACTAIATKPPNGGKPTGRPHGCIHVPSPDGAETQTRYCDRCLVAGICPLPKSWSK